MNEQIILRNIEKKDIEWARRLRNRNRKYFLYNKPVSKEQQEKWYKSLDYSFFIIEHNGMRVGTVAIKESVGQIEVNNVLIEEKHRGKGIFKKAINIIEKKYGKPLYLTVEANNETAINVYQKLGFSIIAYKMIKK